jgi:hypothetical protein
MMDSLSALTDNRYRTTLEESCQPGARTPDRIWYEQIACRGEGCFIGVYSLEPLIFQLSTSRTKNARMVWEAIEGTSGAKADFHFDGEAIIYFPVEVLPRVAEIAGARKKRQLSEAHRAKLAEVGKAHQFKPKIHGSNEGKTGPDLNVLA